MPDRLGIIDRLGLIYRLLDLVAALPRTPKNNTGSITDQEKDVSFFLDQTEFTNFENENPIFFRASFQWSSSLYFFWKQIWKRLFFYEKHESHAISGNN